MEDNRIIELFFDRSEQAITELSNKYSRLCGQLAANILGNRLDAEECVNDAYLAVWNTVPPQSPNPLRTYLCRIVRNLAIKKYHANTAKKRNSVYTVAFEELEPCFASADSVDEAINAQELTKTINTFLETLDPQNRMMFVRRYWYADSIADIAGRFDVSRHNVSVRLSRVRTKLKRYLTEKGAVL